MMTDKELFLRCALETGIKVADHAMTRVEDYNQAVSFFNALRKNKVQLGMDMASLISSGDVEVVEGASQGYFWLVEKDSGSIDNFKFKELVIINGELSDQDSAPEIFIESDEDRAWLEIYSREGVQYPGEGRYLGLQIESEGRIVWDKKSVEEYLSMIDKSYYDSGIVVPPLKRILRNTKRQLLVYLNVQGCKKRHRGNSIIYRARNYTCDDIIRLFSSRYKEIF